MEDVNKQRRNFISLSELEYGPLKFSFREGTFGETSTKHPRLARGNFIPILKITRDELPME